MPSFISVLVVSAVLLTGSSHANNDYAGVDRLQQLLENNMSPAFQTITIQHSRLAEQAGSSLTPSIATIFSDPAVNTAIIQQNPVAALDLPHKVLVYTHDKNTAFITATPDEYLKKRHGGIDDQALSAFHTRLSSILKNIDTDLILPLNLNQLVPGYGIIKHDSKYNFDRTYQRFKEEVLGNNDDTLWFGEIDFTADAAKLGTRLPRMKLLLFGAPAPGAKAMTDFKLLGLNAFCQKVLLIEQQDKVRLYTNDIAALTRLYYKDTHPSHHMINLRLNRAYKRITND